MKDKFKFLYSDSLAKKIKTKAFIITNVIFAIVIIAITNLPNIIQSFGGDFEDEKFIYLEVESEDSTLIYELFEETMKVFSRQSLGAFSYTLTDDSEIEADYRVNIKSVDNFEVDVKKVNPNIAADQILNQVSRVTFEEYAKTINPEIFESFEQVFSRFSYNDKKVIEPGKPGDPDVEIPTPDENQDVKFGVSMVIAMVIFFMIIFSMSFVGGEIIEEKQSKLIETIVSNVKPSTHLVAKLLSILTYLILQLGLSLIYGGIGLLISNSVSAEMVGGSVPNISVIFADVLNVLPEVLLASLPFLLLGFVLYMLLISMFSSMATSIQDYAQFQTPVMLMGIASFYISIFSVNFQGSNIIKALAYVPFISPILTPTLFAGGAIGVVELLISLGILFLTIVLSVKYIFEVYKISLLDYSQDSLFVKLKKVRQTLKNEHKLKKSRQQK